MTIINALRIMTPQKTQQGNDYQHSNIGKYVGTTTGIATSGHLLYTFNKMKKNPEFFEAVNTATINVIEKLSETFGEIKLSPEEINNDIPKFMKKFINRGVFVAAAGIVGLGLGIGAISDAVANHFIKKHADKNIEK